jgi:hypothetical protein
MKADHGSPDVVMLEQLTCVAGIFGRDPIYLAQGVQGTLAYVLEVSNRGSDKV